MESAGLNDATLMQQALGLPAPWTGVGAHFDAEAHRLDIKIDFASRSRVAYPTCGAAGRRPYDTERIPGYA